MTLRVEAKGEQSPVSDREEPVNLRELEQAATPGPWRACSSEAANWKGTTASVAIIEDDEVRSVAPGATPAPPSADAALIAATRNALPFLLDVVEAARATPDDRLIARIERIDAAISRLDSHLSAASERETPE